VSNLFQKYFRSFALVACILGFTLLSHADESSRKVKSRVSPQYPELAKKMNITGSVKLELLVAANGQVKTVKTLGGHPLLIDAAQNAVKQWKYEPGQEGTELVEIRFTNGN
jgi:TonB family protein